MQIDSGCLREPAKWLKWHATSSACSCPTAINKELFDQKLKPITGAQLFHNYNDRNGNCFLQLNCSQSYDGMRAGVHTVGDSDDIALETEIYAFKYERHIHRMPSHAANAASDCHHRATCVWATRQHLSDLITFTDSHMSRRVNELDALIRFSFCFAHCSVAARASHNARRERLIFKTIISNWICY